MISSNFKVIGFERNPFRYSDSHRAEEKGFGVRHIATRAHTHARPAPEFAPSPCLHLDWLCMPARGIVLPYPTVASRRYSWQNSQAEPTTFTFGQRKISFVNTMAVDRNLRACMTFPSIVEEAGRLAGRPDLSFLDCLKVLANKSFVPGGGVPVECRSPPWIPRRGEERLIEFLDYNIRNAQEYKF